MTTAEGALDRRTATRRAEIVSAAAELFLEKGFSRTSMDDVLHEIGGSKRTLYKHFPSKDELFIATIISVSDRVLATLQPRKIGDLKRTLLEFGTRYLEMLVSGEGLAIYRATVSEAPHLPQLAEAFFEHGPGRVSRSLGTFLEARNRRSDAKIRDPFEAAQQFLGMMRGDLHLAALLRPEPPSHDQVIKVVERAVETFLNGALAAGAEAPTV